MATSPGARWPPSCTASQLSKSVDAATVQGRSSEDLEGPQGEQGPIGPQGEPGIGVPTGAVMFFDLEACPQEWEDFAGAQGRAVVGGTAGRSIGTALAAGENRAHQHVWSNLTTADGATKWSSYNARSEPVELVAWENGIGNEGVGFHAIGLWAPGRDWSLHTDEANTAEVMPYLQLLACKKT